MNTNVGSRVKYLVEKFYIDLKKGTKKDFAEAIGLKNHTYLHKVFLKDDLNTRLLNRIAKVLNMEVIDILKEDIHQVSDPKEIYNSKISDSKEVEILRKRVIDLERIIKMQDRELENCNSQLTETFKKKAGKKSY